MLKGADCAYGWERKRKWRFVNECSDCAQSGKPFRPSSGFSSEARLSTRAELQNQNVAAASEMSARLPLVLHRIPPPPPLGHRLHAHGQAYFVIQDMGRNVLELCLPCWNWLTVKKL